LLDLSLKLNVKADFYIFLHDKKSPHSPLGNVWREKLFRIIAPENIQKIERMFLQQKKLGIVGAKDFIKNEYDKKTQNFNCTSTQVLKALIQQYGFTSKNFCFVGGTMFWVRAEIFNNFFLNHEPLSIRGRLESGNVLDDKFGTQTHAWERMLTWIALNQGYSIKGI
jgi:lipopolysaccharide biosynthesis protein